jgi:hypothetical protein
VLKRCYVLFVDEEIRALEQRALASPDDPEAAVRFGLAIARSGDRGRAARELARAVDLAPASESALKALDSVAPGGLDPESPWPWAFGDGRRSRRSTVRGPEKLKVAARILLSRELDLRFDLAVDARGRLLSSYSGGPELGHARARDLNFEFNVELDFLAENQAVEDRLVSVDLSGKLETVPGDLRAGSPVLLAGERIVLVGRDVALAGLGHLFRATRERLEATTLAGAPRWSVPLGTRDIALGPEAELCVVGARELVRLDVATGETRARQSVESPGELRFITLGRDGTAFVQSVDGVQALARERTLFRRTLAALSPAALAGADETVLLSFDITDGIDTWRALDARTGEERWHVPLDSAPKVDAVGRVYCRERDRLVVLDGETGRRLSEVEIGGGWRDFAFTGQGRIALLRRVGVTRTELVVVGE